MRIIIVKFILGDLYDEEEILNWLMTQKDPSGDVIEELEGEQLLDAIHNSEALAVFFCKYLTNQRIFFYHRYLLPTYLLTYLPSKLK